MRASDVARLSEPYGLENHPSELEPMRAVGIDIPRWKQLEAIIFADLVEQIPYGIGWWAPHPGTKKRILISDQLYACTVSVSPNMVEAGLHWLEFVDYAERENNRHADAVKARGGKLIVERPAPKSPLDEIGTPLVRMHAVGVIRSLSGALDCLAGTVIGVLALPQDILKANFRNAHGTLQKMRNLAILPEGAKRQAEFGEKLDEHIASAGPKG